jgi:hypothetical protein
MYPNAELAYPLFLRPSGSMACKVADEDEAFSEESDIAPCKDRRRKYIIASHKIGIITNVVLFVRINSET